MPTVATQISRNSELRYTGGRTWTVGGTRTQTATGSDIQIILNEESRMLSSMSRLVSVPSRIEAEFDRLAAEWKADTFFQSSTTAKMMHSAYQEIIGLGWEVVPLLLRRLQQAPDLW